MKKLEEMTLQELWDLFPVVLSPHDPAWSQWAEEEIALLDAALAGHPHLIHHIGSTAIPSIQAKPIVDILVEVEPGTGWNAIKTIMLDRGYICMLESASRLSFNKGYTPRGYAARVFHVHFHRPGDNDEIIFRDYLLSHPDEARNYERLKQSLLPRFMHDRDAYTAAKSDFVRSIIGKARAGRKK